MADGRGPLKALLAPLFVTINTLFAAVGGEVGRHSLDAARDHLPASLGWTRHDSLIASGVPGGNVAWHLECVPKEVPMLTRVQASCAVLKLRARAPW
jgi:hypothetical protein